MFGLSSTSSQGVKKRKKEEKGEEIHLVDLDKSCKISIEVFSQKMTIWESGCLPCVACTWEGGQVWVHARRRVVGGPAGSAGGRLGVDAWSFHCHAE